MTVGAGGRVPPAPHTVSEPVAVEFRAVTSTETACTPEVGTGPVPATWKLSVCPGPSCATGAPIPVRVSSTRFEISGRKRPAAVAPEALRQPVTTTTASVVPAELKMVALPAPNGTSARLEVAWLGFACRVGSIGFGRPAVQTVRPVGAEPLAPKTR